MYELQCMDSTGRIIHKLTQWDYNQIVVIKGLDLKYLPTFHFYNSASKKSLSVDSYINTSGRVAANIPNELLEQPYPICIDIFDNDSSNSGRVIYSFKIPMMAKPKPTNWIPELMHLAIEQGNILSNGIAPQPEDSGYSNAYIRSTDYLEIEPNTTVLYGRPHNFKIYGKSDTLTMWTVYQYDSNKNFLGLSYSPPQFNNEVWNSVEINSNTKYIKICYGLDIYNRTQQGALDPVEIGGFIVSYKQFTVEKHGHSDDDLSNYYTKVQVNSLIDGVEQKIDTEIESVDLEITDLSENLNTNYYTKSEVYSKTEINNRLDNLSFKQLTQAEYNAIANPDSNTLYIIVG